VTKDPNPSIVVREHITIALPVVRNV